MCPDQYIQTEKFTTIPLKQVMCIVNQYIQPMSREALSGDRESFQYRKAFRCLMIAFHYNWSVALKNLWLINFFWRLMSGRKRFVLQKWIAEFFLL